MPFHSTPTSEKICYGVVLVHPGEFILPELGGKLGRYADEKVRARGVEIHAKSKVATVRPRQIELTNGEKIISSTLVWTAGTSPNPILDLVACAKERGRIKVNPHLEVEGQNGLWALGDCALVPDPATGDFCPPTAQHASREGKFSHITSSRVSMANRRNHSNSKRLDSSQRSVAVPVWRGSWA